MLLHYLQEMLFPIYRDNKTKQQYTFLCQFNETPLEKKEETSFLFIYFDFSHLISTQIKISKRRNHTQYQRGFNGKIGYEDT